MRAKDPIRNTSVAELLGFDVIRAAVKKVHRKHEVHCSYESIPAALFIH